MENNAVDFLKWVGENYDEMRKALKKNRTYNEEIFHQTIVKVYDNIIKKNKVVKSFKDYFFWCAKNNFIQNEKTKVRNSKKIDTEKINQSVEGNDSITTISQEVYQKEIYLTEIDDLFNFILNNIEKEFDTKEVMIWMIYMKLKSKGQITYKSLSKIVDVNPSNISHIIKKINNFVKNNEEIINEKNKLNDI